MRLQKRIHKVVIKIGGRPLLSNNKQILSVEAIEKFSLFINELSNQCDKIIIIAGGAGAHHFTETAKTVGSSESICDLIGIKITEIVTTILLSSLKRVNFDIYPKTINTINDVDIALEYHNICIVSHLEGSASSSDSTACLISEHCSPEMFIILKSNNLYQRISKKTNKSKEKSIHIDLLYSKVKKMKESSSGRPILDSSAMRIIQRNNFNLIMVEYSKLGDLQSYLFNGAPLECVKIISDKKILFKKEIKKLKNSFNLLTKPSIKTSTMKIDEFHDNNHVNRMIKISKTLSKSYCFCDTTIIKLAIIWHDIGRRNGAKGHEKSSAIMLSNKLLTHKFSDAFIDYMHDVIAFHKFNMHPKTIEGHILRDADKLDLLSPERYKISSSYDANKYQIVSLIRELDHYLVLNYSKEIFHSQRKNTANIVRNIL